MRLDEWVQTRGEGAITRLQSQTGLSYTAVHDAVRGKSRPTYATAMRLSAATGGRVSAEEICDPLEIRARASRHKAAARQKMKRKPGKRRTAEAQPSAAAALA